MIVIGDDGVTSRRLFTQLVYIVCLLHGRKKIMWSVVYSFLFATIQRWFRRRIPQPERIIYFLVTFVTLVLGFGIIKHLLIFFLYSVKMRVELFMTSPSGQVSQYSTYPNELERGLYLYEVVCGRI